MAGAVSFPGLVKSPSLVVVSVTPGERREYRSLVLLQLSSGTAGAWWHVRGRPYALSLCGICFWLRVSVGTPARGYSANLLVRYVVVERNGGPVGSNRGRDLLRGAVGDYSAPIRYDDRSGHYFALRG